MRLHARAGNQKRIKPMVKSKCGIRCKHCRKPVVFELVLRVESGDFCSYTCLRKDTRQARHKERMADAKKAN
jgi:hypothetical protein